MYFEWKSKWKSYGRNTYNLFWIESKVKICRDYILKSDLNIRFQTPAKKDSSDSDSDSDDEPAAKKVAVKPVPQKKKESSSDSSGSDSSEDEKPKVATKPVAVAKVYFPLFSSSKYFFKSKLNKQTSKIK